MGRPTDKDLFTAIMRVICCCACVLQMLKDSGSQYAPIVREIKFFLLTFKLKMKEEIIK